VKKGKSYEEWGGEDISDEIMETGIPSRKSIFLHSTSWYQMKEYSDWQKVFFLNYNKDLITSPGVF